MNGRSGWLIGSAAGAVAVYALLWVGYVQGWGWLQSLDTAALERAYAFAADRPGWVTAWDVFCTVLGPGVFRLVTLVVIVAALVRRQFRPALFLLVSVELSGIVTEIAKYLADRPRPSTAMVDALSTSFPSGHALGVTVAVVALLTVARARPALVAAGVAVVVAIGVGRVVLNVHHPSDVVAGWALGWAYVVGCVALVPPWRTVTAPGGTPAELGTAR